MAYTIKQVENITGVSSQSSHAKDRFTLGTSHKLQNYYNKERRYKSLNDNAGGKKRVSKS